LSLNRPHTPEEKHALSLKLKGRKFSDEHKARISLALKGKPKSETAKANMRGTKGRLNLWAIGKPRPDLVGPNNYNWRGGCYRLDIPYLEWEKLRIATLRAHGWTCRCCGKNANNARLDVHHVVPYRISRDNSRDNLIVLCASCHGKAESRLWPIRQRMGVMEIQHG
jgi:5-methylcytosine-specific restriction endonuclease McrA